MKFFGDKVDILAMRAYFFLSFKWVFTLLILIVPLLSIAGGMNRAQNGSCGDILFDCDQHKMIYKGQSGKEAKLDCGSSTPSIQSKLISADPIIGTVAKCLAGTPGVEYEGGGAKKIHTWDEPCTSHNQAGPFGITWGLGCMILSMEDIKELQQCVGSPIQIINKSGGSYSRGGFNGREKLPNDNS